MSLSSLHARLASDRLRTKLRFSDDLNEVHAKLFAAGLSDHDRFEILRSWIATNQPCLFGRLAAKLDRLGFCILTAEDIERGDRHVREKIQVARRQWKRDALRGKKSGFVISVQTIDLVSAVPDKTMLDFAIHLTKLYLNAEIEPDTVYLDQVMHRHTEDEALAWRVGANFFASAGDGRWWHDHRFPGGIALSMNSVGHMVHASANWPMDGAGKNAPKPKTLGEALRLAMQTISLAKDACSGVATWLLERKEGDACPHADDTWPSGIKGKERRNYEGWYHTDHTIPSPYFALDIERPAAVTDPHNLDFSYLWDDSDDNPDHQTMGLGERLPR